MLCLASQANVFKIDFREKVVFNTSILSIKINHVHKLMENAAGSRDGKTKEVKTKGARGISLRACVAKVTSWTLEKANSTTSQEASINKAL